MLVARPGCEREAEIVATGGVYLGRFGLIDLSRDELCVLERFGALVRRMPAFPGEPGSMEVVGHGDGGVALLRGMKGRRWLGVTEWTRQRDEAEQRWNAAMAAQRARLWPDTAGGAGVDGASSA